MLTMIELPWTIDTNILVYATETDAPVEKQLIAKQLMKRLTLSPQACLVGQVVGEFMNVVLRKKAMTHAQAWKLAAKHKYQGWDALIVAICAEHGVKTLYSEGAGSLKRPLGVHVINPFANLKTP